MLLFDIAPLHNDALLVSFNEHGAYSILCQHPAMDFHRFNPICPQKMQYGALFLDGAIAEWTTILLSSLLSAM
jgi:hypothetical protein